MPCAFGYRRHRIGHRRVPAARQHGYLFGVDEAFGLGDTLLGLGLGVGVEQLDLRPAHRLDPAGLVDLVYRHVLGLLVLQADRRGRTGERQDVADLDHGLGFPRLREDDRARHGDRDPQECVPFHLHAPFRFEVWVLLPADRCSCRHLRAEIAVKAREVPKRQEAGNLPRLQCIVRLGAPAPGGVEATKLQNQAARPDIFVEIYRSVRVIIQTHFSKGIHEVKATIESLAGPVNTY